MAAIADPADETFIHQLLSSRYGREITRLSRFPASPNARVYALSVTAAAASFDAKSLPEATGLNGLSPLQDGAHELIMRMPIAGSGPTDSVRVQNEVAAMALASQALESLGERIVPRVYGWEPADSSNGWVLCDRMPGIPVRDKFFDLDDDAKRHIVSQMAQILRCLQQFQVPSTANAFGGLNFDAAGDVVVGPTSIPGGGPCSSHGALYAEILDTQLSLAKGDAVVRGWAGTDLPERFEKVKQYFVSSQNGPRPTLVHGDFDVQNILFNTETNQITGLIDFEFSQIASPADEFLTASFSRLHHLMPSELNDDEQALLRKSLLTGFDSALAKRPKKSGIDWKLAVMVDEELAKAGATRPCDVPDMAEIHRRYAFVDNVMPPAFYAPHIQEATREKKDSFREEKMRELEAALNEWGI